MDRGQFKTGGGVKHIDKAFDGHLEPILGDLLRAAVGDAGTAWVSATSSREIAEFA